MKRFWLPSLIGLVMALYTTFVVENLWNWFATSAFHVTEISFWGTYGLILLISALRLDQSAAHQKWKLTMTVLELCVPDAKRKEFDELIEAQTKGFGFLVEAGSQVFAELAGNTFLLVLGFLVHVLLA